MDNKILKEINSIGSLMNRMDNPVSGYEAMLNEGHDIANRVRFDTIIDLLSKNVQNGKLMSMGYVNSVKVNERVSATPENRKNGRDILGLSDDEIKSSNKYTSSENMRPYQKMDGWRDTLGGLVNSKDWDDIENGVAKRKTFDTPASVKSVISFTQYVWNWQDKEGLAKSFDSLNNKEIELRRKYGFGKNDSEYPEDDWRRNPSYGGLRDRREVAEKDRNKGSSYIDSIDGNYNIYNDVDMQGNPRYDENGHQKQTLRQNMVGIHKQRTDYFIVDADEKIHRIPYQVKNYLNKGIGSKRAAKVVNYLNDEERAFNEELKRLKNENASVIKQFDLDKIAYIVATVKNPETGEKERAYWINDNLRVNASQDEVQDMINTELGIGGNDIDSEELNSMM